MRRYHLYGSPGSGSALAELFLTAAKIPFKLTEIDWGKRKSWGKVFGKYNPLLQVPTLVIDRKQVMTESLSIAVHCDSRGAKLIPKGKSADEFWRWAIFMVANIYPTFTYRDNADQFAKGKAAQDYMSKKIMRRRKKLWLQMENEAQSPWFLGNKMSAIDYYIAVMNRWTPGKAWFEKNCPRLTKIASKVEARKAEGAIIRRHSASN